MPVDVFVEYFVVGDGCLQISVPVHQTLTAIDQAVAEHLEERPAHGFAADIVQRKPDTSPVAAGTDLFELIQNAAFVVILPLPDAFDESVATDVVARQFFFFQHAAFDDRLSGDAGVIGARHPQGHSCPASAASESASPAPCHSDSAPYAGLPSHSAAES